MTNAPVVPPPPPQRAAAVGAPAGVGAPPSPSRRAVEQSDLAHVIRRRLVASIADTPGRLRALGITVVIGCLAFAVTVGVSTTSQSSDLTSAKNHAAQVVRLQSIRANLLTADANATNAFLVGGLEPTSEAGAYQAAVAAASSSIATASGSESADAPLLNQVNAVLSQYTGLVASAQANNRQGFPVGAAYLRQATDLLHNSALPQLDYLVRFERARVDDAFAANSDASKPLGIVWALALIVLIITQGWLFLRTRRVLNVGLAAATIAVLVAGVAGVAISSWARDRAHSVQTGSYATASELSTSRVAAFDAKSNESLTLIARGSGQAYEADFQSLAATAAQSLALLKSDADTPKEALLADFAAYRAVHTEIRAADDGGNWDAAVKLATETSGSSNANQTFAAFDRASAGSLDAKSKLVTSQLNGTSGPLTFAFLLGFLAGLVAAGLAWWGVSKRLEEYR